MRGRRAWESAVETLRRRPARAMAYALRREERVDALLGSLRAAVIILWGDADRIIPIEVGRRLHRLIPGSRFEPLARCGHLPHQDCPETTIRALF